MRRQNRIALLNIVSTVLLQGISLFTSPLFSRLLGTDGYGVISTYNTWVSAAAIVCSLQTYGTLVNARVEYPEEEQRRYQSSVMTLSLLFFLLCSGVAVLFLKPVSGLLKLRDHQVALLLWHAFGVFCLNFLNSKFTYEFKAGRNMLLSLGITVSSLILSLILVLNMPQQERYAGRLMGVAIPYGILGIAACGGVLLRGKCFFSRKYWKFCLPLALPMVFYSLSDLLLGHSDLVMLRSIAGDGPAGIYGLAYLFGSAMFTIFTGLNNSWTPFFFEDMKQGRDVRSQAKNFLELFTVLSMGFVLLTREVYHIFAREDYWEGTVLIPLFTVGYYLNFLCTFPINFEYFHKKTKVVAAATVVSSLLNVALNYVFIHRFGMMGAAAATLLSRVFQYSVHYLYCRYVLGKQSYPFGAGLWWKYAAVLFLTTAAALMTPEKGILRWLLGACLGVWELLRIRKRKVLI